jgi:hypothetical protein
MLMYVQYIHGGESRLLSHISMHASKDEVGGLLELPCGWIGLLQRLAIEGIARRDMESKSARSVHSVPITTPS